MCCVAATSLARVGDLNSRLPLLVCRWMHRPSVCRIGRYFRAHENNLPLFLALLIDCRDDSELFLAVVRLSDTVGLLRWYGVRLTTTVVARRRQKHSTSNFNSNFYLDAVVATLNIKLKSTDRQTDRQTDGGRRSRHKQHTNHVGRENKRRAKGRRAHG